VDCAEILRCFVSGSVPHSPAVETHLKGCARCRVLFEQDAQLGRRLAEEQSPPADGGDSFKALESSLSREVGLRAKLRAWPTRARVAVLVGLPMLILASKLVWGRRPDYAAYSGPAFWSFVLLLAVGLAAGVWRLARGASRPLQSQGREWTITWLLLVLPALAALSFPAGDWFGAEAWGTPGKCFGFGAMMAAPFLLAAWLFERRDAVPRGALVLTAALAGVSANLVLHAHCASTHLGHLLLGHASIGVAFAAALSLIGGRALRSG